LVWDTDWDVDTGIPTVVTGVDVDNRVLVDTLDPQKIDPPPYAVDGLVKGVLEPKALTPAPVPVPCRILDPNMEGIGLDGFDPKILLLVVPDANAVPNVSAMLFPKNPPVAVVNSVGGGFPAPAMKEVADDDVMLPKIDFWTMGLEGELPELFVEDEPLFALAKAAAKGLELELEGRLEVTEEDATEENDVRDLVELFLGIVRSFDSSFFRRFVVGF